MIYTVRPDGVRDSQLATTYEVLGNKRVLFLYSYILGYPDRPDGFGVAHLSDTMMAMNMQNHDPIWLFVHSPGGSIDEGLMLIDTMQAIESPVYTVGRATASMGTVILAAGEPSHRYLSAHAKVMLHLVSGAFGGDVKDVKIATEQMEKTQETLTSMLMEYGVKDLEQLEKDLDRDFWLNAQEAIDYGLADKIFTRGLLPTDVGE